jgi:CDP-glycerol glycerophosphotransferase (TagB/SpsB family)
VFAKIGKYLLRLLCVGLVSLVPKNKSIWVFGAWFGKNYSDNPKYMYQYVASLNSKDEIPIWIAKDIGLVSELKKQGVNAYYHNSFKGIYYQIVAKVAFVGHSISSDLNPWVISFNTKRVQLWHGIPLKKIGFDDHIFTSKETLIQKYPRLFSLLTNDRYDLVTSSGDSCSKLFSSAFNIPLNKIVATGFPRNDVFLSTQVECDVKTSYKVIYMPTFRGDIGDEFDLFETFGFDIDKIEKVFQTENIELTIRTHPANKPSEFIISKIKNAKRIKISTVSDIYEEIHSYDCLITDYSSIMFDFAITGKPILFAAFDLDDYLEKDREIYFSYEDISSGVYYSNWSSLLVGILNTKNNPQSYPASFLQSFHENIISSENEYSMRVFNCVRSRFNNFYKS